MSIEFPCPSCGTRLTAPDKAAGKFGKCKKCGASAVVPSLQRNSDQPTDTPTTDTEPGKPKKRIPPATERQKEYARDLGIMFPANINIREMSALIDAASDKADEERWRKIEDLSDKESAAYAHVRQEVLNEVDTEDCRLSKATPTQMIDALEERGTPAILVANPAGNAEAGETSICYTSHFDEKELAAALLQTVLLVTRKTHPEVAQALEKFLHMES